MSRRCEDDGHPWPWSSLSLPNPPTPSRSTRYIFISPPSLLVPYPSDTSEAIIASHDPRCEVRPSPCRPFVPSRPETGFSQGGAVERGSMGSEVFYARNNQTEKQKESLALIRPVRFFRHRVRVSRGHLRRIGRMTTTSDRAINEEQKTSCEACKACEESNEKKLVDLARCSVILVLSARTLSVDRSRSTSWPRYETWMCKDRRLPDARARWLPSNRSTFVSWTSLFHCNPLHQVKVFRVSK